MQIDNMSPTAYAHCLWSEFEDQSKRKDRSDKGQFMTPQTVAEFMASLFPKASESVTLLDPGAGTGILAAAVAEKVVRDGATKNLKIELYELDPNLTKYLERSMEYLQNWCEEKGVSLSVLIKPDDFVIENQHTFESVRKLCEDEDTGFDWVIMNPPYFKLNKSDPRAKAASGIVHGQPNIYFLFLMLGALLLREAGVLVSISPRSFTSGLYFKAFRSQFFDRVHPTRLHLFSSRTRTFKASDVLQETLIMQSTLSNSLKQTTITSCMGVDDLVDLKPLSVQTDQILRTSDGKVLFIPTSKQELRVMEEVERWPETITTLGFRVSTGPVVPFRATKFLRNEFIEDVTVPLFWMHNVKQQKIDWPRLINKPQYIEHTNQSTRLLLPVSPYVLLHRFSAKEQMRRFTVAPFIPIEFNYKRIGIENHVNYIHRPDSVMLASECYGLSAILGTKLLDMYIRIRSGNTQVNASDMKFLPLPSHSQITKIGEKIEKEKTIDDDRLEYIVLKELNLLDIVKDLY